MVYKKSSVSIRGEENQTDFFQTGHEGEGKITPQKLDLIIASHFFKFSLVLPLPNKVEGNN